MGLAEVLFGAQSPIAQWAGQNQNFLGAVGAGLGQGQNIQSGLSAGLAAVPGAKALDREHAEKLKAEAKIEAQTNATQAYLRREHPDIAHLPPERAWEIAMARERAKIEGATPMQPTANMQDYMFAQEHPGYAEFINPSNGADAPSGYQFVDGQLAPIPGGPADPSNPLNMKRVGQGPMSPTTQKELFEADDAAKAGDYVLSALDEAQQLNDAAYDGPLADVRGDTTALFGDQSGVATSRLKNVTTELALSQLKTIFGSMPTEGERKILLELQGSVNQPKQVRAAIFKRAKEMAIRRIEDNKAKAAALRSGAYFEEGYGGGQTAPAASGNGWTVLGVE